MPPKHVPVKKPSGQLSNVSQQRPGIRPTAAGRGLASNKTGVTNKTVKPGAAIPTTKKPPSVGVKGVTQQQSSKSKIGTGKTPAKPVKYVWTEKDNMARKIQSFYRGYRCRRLLRTLQHKRKEYEEMMDKLEKDAFVHMAKMEQEKAAKERERETEQRRKRQEEAKRVKRFLEASFDGDCGELESLLNEVAKLHANAGDGMVARFQYKLVECTDANNNTPLSEAAAGGDPETISFLTAKGAKPNSKGQYGRTPLYRAAFGGHTEAVKKLLAVGADPRIYADDGAIPENVASGSVMEAILKEWNIEETETLVKKLEEEMRNRKEKEDVTWKTEEEKLQGEINEVEKEHSAKQKELTNAHIELNKRIIEHDKCVFDNYKPELTLLAVQDAEDHLERCKLHAQTAKDKLTMVKLKLRMKRKEFTADDEEIEDECKVDIVIRVKELDDVLMKDVGDKISQSERCRDAEKCTETRWPMVIDPSRQCATFLKYRDTNYFNVVNPKHMEPETIRMGLLGAVRYGKFFVLDFQDIIEDMWDAVTEKFNQVQKDLLPSIMNRDFIKEQRYLKLTKKSDGDEYSVNAFLSARTHNFKLVILTQLTTPPPELLEQTYTIKIHIEDPFAL